MFLSELRL